MHPTLTPKMSYLMVLVWQVASLELLAQRLVETLQVSVDEAERLKSMVNRTGSTGRCFAPAGHVDGIVKTIYNLS